MKNKVELLFLLSTITTQIQQSATAMKMELSMSLLLLSLTWWIELSNSLCSLQINPTVRDVRITIDCGGQCRPSSNFNYGLCDIFNTFGIERCYQGQCESKIYNLSACITRETAIDPTSSTSHVNTNSIATMEQSQTTTEAQLKVVIGALVGLLVVLLVMAIIPWIWICWKFKGPKPERQRTDKTHRHGHHYFEDGGKPSL